MTNVSDFTFIQYPERTREVNHRRFNKFAITAADFFCKNRIGLHFLQKYVFSVLLFPFHRYK